VTSIPLGHEGPLPQREAKVVEPTAVSLLVRMAPIHRHARDEPVILRAGVGLDAHDDEKVPAGPKPPVDVGEYPRLLGHRHVDDRIERHDGVERHRFELHGRHIAHDELGIRYEALRSRDLYRRDVDADHPEPVRQYLGGRHSSAAPEIQHRGSLWELGHQWSEPPAPLFGPVGALVVHVGARDSVIAFPHDPLWFTLWVSGHHRPKLRLGVAVSGECRAIDHLPVGDYGSPVSGFEDGSERDPSVTRILQRTPVVTVEPPSPLRNPVRVLTAAGAVVTIVSSILPWAILEEFPEGPTRSGWGGRLDGFLLAVIATGMLVVVASRAFAESTTRSVRVLPLILGATGLVLWFGGFQFIDAELAQWRQEGGVGSLQPWLFVCLVGASIMAAGGVWLGLRRGFSSLSTGDPGEAEIVTRTEVAHAVLGAAGGTLGALIALAFTLTALASFPLTLPFILATLFGALLGAWLGVRIGQRLFPH
jgi:hypothetical protein